MNPVEGETLETISENIIVVDATSRFLMLKWFILTPSGISVNNFTKSGRNITRSGFSWTSGQIFLTDNSGKFGIS